jgi:hypothetical protein
VTGLINKYLKLCRSEDPVFGKKKCPECMQFLPNVCSVNYRTMGY